MEINTVVQNKHSPSFFKDGDYFLELELIKHLYGHLLTLATRSFSIANTLAVSDAMTDIQLILKNLQKTSTTLLSKDYFELIESYISLHEILPMSFVSNTLIKSIYHQLCKLVYPVSLYPIVYVEEFNTPASLQYLVVHVGPTIGLGDELIIAHALSQRFDQSNLKIFVSTKRIGLWDFLPLEIQHIGSIPCAHVKFLSEKSQGFRKACGYLFVDFLEEPVSIPLFTPDELLFSASWIFGKSQCIIVDIQMKKVFSFHYPTFGMANRSIECGWITQKLFPNLSISSKKSNHSEKLNNTMKTLVIQILTSKPELVLPPAFFVDIAQQIILNSTTPFLIKIISGPNKESSKITQRFYDLLSHSITNQEIILLQPTDTNGIVQEIKMNTVLLGPDTFTSHIAAFRNVPQVTIFLKEHKPWLNTCTPSLYVECTTDLTLIKHKTIERLLLLFSHERFNLLKINNFLQDLASWNNHTSDVFSVIINGPQQFNTIEKEKLKDQIKQIKELSRKYQHLPFDIFMHCQNQFQISESLLHYELEDYPHPDDMWLSLSRWIAAVGSSELSGIFYCLNNIYLNECSNGAFPQANPYAI